MADMSAYGRPKSQEDWVIKWELNSQIVPINYL